MCVVAWLSSVFFPCLHPLTHTSPPPSLPPSLPPGLDSFQAQSVMSAMGSLARSGRTVVAGKGGTEGGKEGGRKG